jgi:hypothetical protein
MNPITKPDTLNTDPEYWEMVLESHGLGLEQCGLLNPDPISESVWDGFFEGEEEDARYFSTGLNEQS